ncbi:hypothetical protein AAIR98_001232 [Elusimicrobium simillimum]|uniref:hypothetical protein n=1 Tax=Elusimicrobium simillimum TaxID=3143438 RepID=UPI003C701D4D
MKKLFILFAVLLSATLSAGTTQDLQAVFDAKVKAAQSADIPAPKNRTLSLLILKLYLKNGSLILSTILCFPPRKQVPPLCTMRQFHFWLCIAQSKNCW